MGNGVDDFFEKSFLESGGSLEAETSNILSQYFHTDNQPAFLDLDEGKSREGDILAKETFPILAKETFPSVSEMESDKHMLAQLILTVECKNLPDHGWIFTQGKIKQHFQPFTLIRTNDHLIKNLYPQRTLDEIIGTNNSFERFLDNKKTEQQNRTNKQQDGTNKQTNNIHDSSLKVIKLTRYLKNEDIKDAKSYYKHYNSRTEVVFFKIYQPLIVFNGHLYVKKINEQKIIPVGYLQFTRQYKSQSYNEDVTIHVVSSDHIQKYLNIIRPYYMECSRYIIDHQSEITDAVRNDLIHWDDFNPFPLKV